MIETESPQPLVTVYMPTYNRVKLLQRAVESVLNQDYRNIELIVVDDNSIDGTHDYLAKVAKEDIRFRYFINRQNSGACVSRNKAIFSANGKFITGLDDDDYFLPNRISSFLKTWEGLDSKFIALYSNLYLKNQNGNTEISKKIKTCNYNDLICFNSIGNQIFTKTDYLLEIGGFDTNLSAWQDLECWYRLLKTFNSQAYLSQEHTYVVDQSHPHERITNSKTNSIIDSYNYITSKHKLKSYEKRILSLQLNSYMENTLSISSIFLSVIYRPELYNLRRSASLLLQLIKIKPQNN